MRKSLLGLVIGWGLGISFTILSSLYAQDDRLRPVLQSGLIGQLDRIIKTYCDVYVARGNFNATTRCPRNEVMTGLANNGYYCSAITVECFGKQIVLSADEN